jgi:hypothetical protein
MTGSVTSSPGIWRRESRRGRLQAARSVEICGKANGCAELTDGVYLWPEGLAHYVLEHSVKLPDDVLDHITHRQDELSALDVDRAWWPRVASLENREK